MAGYAVSGQAKRAAPAPPPASTTRDLDVVYADADIDEATGVVHLTKATVRDGDTVIVADKADINRRTRVIEASGNLQVTDPQADVTGQKATVYYARAKRLAVLTGEVRITIKPKQDAPPGPAPVSVQGGVARVGPDNSEGSESASGVRKRGALVTCDKVEYEYGKDKKHATLTGSFKAVQKLTDNTRTLTAEHAEWYGKDERLVLHPPVHVEDTKGMRGDSQTLVTVLTHEGGERIKLGPGKATIPVEDDEEDTGAAPAPGAPAPGKS